MTTLLVADTVGMVVHVGSHDHVQQNAARNQETNGTIISKHMFTSHSHITLTHHIHTSHSHIILTHHTHTSHSHITFTHHTHTSHSCDTNLSTWT